MTKIEKEYRAGKQAFLSGKPFISTMSVAWQNGWLDAYDNACDARFGPNHLIETSVVICQYY